VNQACAEALQAAIELAKQGLPTFPCSGVHKRPTTPHGFYDASTDPAALHTLWRHFPGPLVGVRTGTVSAIAVLDLDRKHQEAADWWEANRPQLPITRTHRTRSGGLHLIFRHIDGVRCTTGRLAPGVDTKGEGGCAIWWPASGLPVLCDPEPAAWPNWLLAQLQPSPLPPRRPVVPDDRSLRGILSRVATASEGTRNMIAHWGACRLAEMVATGLIGEGDAIALLVDAAMVAGLSRREALATARSGLRTGAARS
jgi:hypothetical protein